MYRGLLPLQGELDGDGLWVSVAKEDRDRSLECATLEKPKRHRRRLKGAKTKGLLCADK